MDFIAISIAVLFAITYGVCEQYTFRHWWKPQTKPVFNHLHWYHVFFMFPVFLIVSWATVWQLLPLMILLEDISFFVFHSQGTLDADSWVNWGLGGFYVSSQWVPMIYLILIILFLLLLLI